jgi:hypothetical protein
MARIMARTLRAGGRLWRTCATKEKGCEHNYIGKLILGTSLLRFPMDSTRYTQITGTYKTGISCQTRITRSH